MSLLVGEVGYEDKTGGGRVFQLSSIDSARLKTWLWSSMFMLKHRDFCLLPCRCTNNPSRTGLRHWKSMVYVSCVGLFLTGNLLATRPYSGCNQFFQAPPHPPIPAPEPHPQYSGDYGQTQEAVLEVRRTGPGPSVSPRLKGSDYMENWMQHATHMHTKAPPSLMSHVSCLTQDHTDYGDGGLLTSQLWFVLSNCKTGHVTGVPVESRGILLLWASAACLESSLKADK